MLVNAYCTHRAPPALAFPHELHSRRSVSDPDLPTHLRGFMGFVMAGGERPMSQTRYAVLRHLERVQHHLALEVDERDFEAFAAWAREANALLFLTDATVRAPDGSVLVDPTTGEPEPHAVVPYPRDAVARKAATDRALAERGIRVPPTLPPVVGEVEVALRPAAEVAARCAALFAVALRAESLATGDELRVDDIRQRLPAAEPAMSPRERAFFLEPAPPRQAIVDHAWRYEALAALAWALGRLDALPHPDRICDVPALARLMLDPDGLREARLRPTAEILDALDLHFRVHWAVTEARATQTPPPAGLDPGVIVERHHALNWLTRFEDAAWDDVTTPT